MLIHLQDVSFTYGIGSGYESCALSQVNLKIDAGEFIALTGHTGSGKTTLTQVIDGLQKPTSGRVIYREKDIYAKDFSRKQLHGKIGLVFQYPEYQLFEVSVIKDVEYGPKNIGMDPLQMEYRSYQALKQVGISEDLIDVSPLALSGGQKRRVAIAGVLAMDPEVLILDEPTAGLDPEGRTEILDMLKELQRVRNITILLVTHSMDDVAAYADRMLVMNQGKLVLDGTPQKIFSYENELKQIGLGVPQVTEILHSLQERGIPIDTEAVSVQDAATLIAKICR
jgi:energy-coupling factor transport system ATP-binding protein